MPKRNPLFETLPQTYLFRRMQQIAHKKENVLDLSVGDTAYPIAPAVAKAMQQKVEALTHASSYTGYGAGQGELPLRQVLAKRYGVDSDEIFISDGAKCDIGRLQILFGSDVTIAVQDPAYPVYVETSHLLGQKNVLRMPCTPENGYFPTLVEADLLYFCSPHNPTGYAASYEELEHLVSFAQKCGALIIYDSAYANFIQEERPRSIYEIEGAKEVAIEVGSFSKSAGFTGVRLGWSVVPKTLTYRDGRPIHPDWLRIATTFFNAASNIAQAGGVEALAHSEVAPYMENARLLRSALRTIPHVGGINSPYIWAYFDAITFEQLLDACGVLAIPGEGFGPSGKGFLRLSALAKRETVEQAARRLDEYCRTLSRPQSHPCSSLL